MEEQRGVSLNLNLLNTPNISRRLTVPNVLGWLENSGLDDDVLDLMRQQILRYPRNSLRHYIENINSHVLKAQQEVQKKRESDNSPNA